jgi:hypothetical protein
MAERLVDIPVTQKTRDAIKKLKKEKTYEDFLKEELL